VPPPKNSEFEAELPPTMTEADFKSLCLRLDGILLQLKMDGIFNQNIPFILPTTILYSKTFLDGNLFSLH
jgi:hypothetical protein